MPNVTFEQQLLSDVVKQVISPEKIKAMATKLAPVIDKAFEKAVTDYVKDMFDDNYYINELIEHDRDIQNTIKNKLRAAFGVPALETTKKKR